MSTKEPFKVAVLLFDNLLATSATMPMEMLRTAQAAAQQVKRDARSIELYCLSVEGRAARSAAGFTLQADGPLDDQPYNLVHIPGQWRNPRPALRKYAAALPWLRAQAERGALVSAVGTGVCFLAEAGLLDDKPATTHWHYFDRFQRDYPAVQLKRQYFITQAANLYCAASVNALGELTVHMIHRLYGSEVATHVARHFFHEIRNLNEPVGYLADQVQYHPDEQVAQAQIWLQDNFGRSVRMAELASQLGMSVRTFNRRFKAALGKTPLTYLQEIRLENARELLQKANLSVAEVAGRVGYQDTGAFSKLFTTHYHTSPTRYREVVRAKLFKPEKTLKY
ncbi:MAG: helix-turn-helix domain-containing protein [Porticoccaceae bacterium]|nr:helix-turn-helix domain-containing protein [Porticoccaceae bacterium]